MATWQDYEAEKAKLPKDLTSKEYNNAIREIIHRLKL